MKISFKPAVAAAAVSLALIAPQTFAAEQLYPPPSNRVGA